MLLAFYLRIQSAFPTNAGAYLYEFDPYYYTTATQFIIQDGGVPRFDDLAWYPNHDTSHRVPPLPNYLSATWYSIAANGKPFDLYSLGFASSMYPPVVAAASVFLAFLLLNEPYGRKAGVIAAGLFAFAPQIIQNLAAWEQQATPWGVFGAVFFYAAYALVINRKNRTSAILAGLALATLTLGSKADVQAYLLLAGYVAVQGTIDFLKGRTDWKFLEANAIVFGFAVAANIIMYLGYASVPSFPISDLFPFAAVLYFYFALTAVNDCIAKSRAWSQPEQVLLFPMVLVERFNIMELGKERINYLSVLLVLGLAVLFLTPLGPPVLGYIKNAAGNALPRDPLANTVAEEGGTGNQFVSAIGPVGIPLKILFENGLLAGTAGYVVLLAPFLIALYLAWKHDSHMSIYFAFLVLPVVFVGLGKVKFVLQLAIAMVLGFAAVLGGIFLMVRERVKDESRLQLYERAIFGAGAIVLLLTAWPSMLLIAASTNSDNYADLGSGVQGMDCNKLGPSIQGNLFELESGDKNGALQLAYYLYCSKIPQWWLDPMTWISQNVAQNDRVIHWWDYGHWTNYFGQRKTITRNDHVYPMQDLEMADLLVDGTPQYAAQWMRAHQAKYLLVDQDLIGKWGALVYLSCVQNNETQFIPRQVGASKCEAEHYFERIFVPAAPTDADKCNIGSTFPMFRSISSIRGPVYCIGQPPASGTTPQPVIVAYEANATQVRAVLSPQGTTNINGIDYAVFNAYYPPPGQGFEDRAGKAYDSVFYQAFFLGHLDGFTQVFPYEAEFGQIGGQLPVRIFKLNDDASAQPAAQPPVFESLNSTTNSTSTGAPSGATPNGTG
jgi:asparagine N-glycosylation enzyme membrane subunit Stt3